LSRDQLKNRFAIFQVPLRRPATGAAFILTLFGLAGCLAPLTQREAQSYAQLSLRRYCSRTLPCHPARFVKAQHLPTGWLLDYESDTVKYGVMVRENGGTQVSVWDKKTGAAR
jgi:hypothetical protein